MNISDIIIPFLVTMIILFGLYKKNDVFSDFSEGAKDGLVTSFKILPNLLGLLVAVKAFTASGALEIMENIIEPAAKLLKFPKELIGYSILRPVSGSGSLALATDIFSRFGTDSFIGRAVSVMMGSSETTFYTVSVYFASVNVRNVHHTLACALFADVVCAFVSVAVCRVMF